MKRKLGLSGRKRRQKAAVREGKVHSMMYTRQEVRVIMPEGGGECGSWECGRREWGGGEWGGEGLGGLLG